MGIIVNKTDEQDSELNRRIAAELRQRTQENSKLGADPDLAEDSEYVPFSPAPGALMKRL